MDGVASRDARFVARRVDVYCCYALERRTNLMPDSAPRGPEQADPVVTPPAATEPEPATTSPPSDVPGVSTTQRPPSASMALPDFGPTPTSDEPVQPIDLLRDVGLHVKIELGRCRMLLDDVLRLSEGSIVELDKLAGDPVDIYANDRLVARGEVLVLNDNFCVRVNEILAENTREFE